MSPQKNITAATMGALLIVNTHVKAVTYSEMCAMKMQKAREYIFIASLAKRGEKNTYNTKGLTPFTVIPLSMWGDWMCALDYTAPLSR